MCIGLFFFPDHCTKQIDSMLPWVGVVKTDVRQHGIYFLNNLHPVWSSLGFWFQFFDEHTRPFLPPEFLTPSNRAFSFTWPASTQICWSKRKVQLHWQVLWWLTRPPSTGVVTNTAAVPFFWNTNSVAVTSHFWLHFLYLSLFENITFN